MEYQDTFLSKTLLQNDDPHRIWCLVGYDWGRFNDLLDRLPSPALRDSLEETAPSEPETFAPFFRFLKRRTEELGWTIRDLLDRSSLYPPHKEVWKSILEGNLGEPREDILPGELDWEELQYRKDLRSLITAVLAPTSEEGPNHPPPVLALWSALDYSPSTWDCIEDFFQKKDSPPFILLLGFPAVPGDIPETLSRSGRVISIQDGKHTPALKPPLGVEGPLIPLLQARQAFSLCAQKDARRWLEGLWSRSPEQAFPIGQDLGRLNFHQRELDSAMTYFQGCLAWAQKEGDRQGMAWAYRWMARVYVKEDQMDQALMVLEKSRKIYKDLQDELGLIHADVVNFLLEDRRRFQGLPEFKKFYLDLLSRCENHRLWNYYVYVASNPFGLYSFYDPEIEAIHARGLKIAKRLGNLHRLAAAYQTMGLAAAVRGDLELTLKCYRRSRHLKIRLGNQLELAYIQNGLGFYSLLAGQYPAALGSFRTALDLLARVQDFHEVGMTYFNMAMTALLARKPDLASQFLETLGELMSAAGLRNLKYHSRIGILALTGVCRHLAGDEAKARQSLLTIRQENLEPFPKKNEEFFFLFLLKFLLCEDPEAPDAQGYIREAADYLDRSNDDIRYMGPFFFHTLAERASPQEREYYLSEGLRRAEEKNYQCYIDWFSAWKDTGQPKASQILNRVKPDSPCWLIHSARLQGRMVELHKRTEDIHFLNALQTLINEEWEERSLIQKSVDLIFSSYGAQGVFYHTQVPTGLRLMYSRRRTAVTGDHFLPHLVAHLGLTPDTRLFPPQDTFQNDLDESLRKCTLGSFFVKDRNETKGHFLIFFEETQPDWEKIKTLSIMALQVGLGLDRILQHRLIQRQNEDLQRKNRLLEVASSSDALTGTGNRQALEKSLHQELARVRRYKAQPFSLLFIDLDNFKFFNDTFGHGIGDLLLVETSQLFQNRLRETDSLFRYGGDEFILILPETPLEGAMQLGQRMIQALEQTGSFLSLIQARQGTTVYIPQDRKLSCSIGVVQWGPGMGGDSPEKLLQMADKALYTAKKAGKGRVRVLDFPSA